MPEDTELLRPAEERAYRLLVRLSVAHPADLARVASIPQAEAARLLESLRAKGLVTAGPVFQPLPPDVALGDVLLRRQQSLESDRQVVAGLSEEYRTRARRRSADHLVEIVVGAEALRERLRDMQNTSALPPAGTVTLPVPSPTASVSGLPVMRLVTPAVSASVTGPELSLMYVTVLVIVDGAPSPRVRTPKSATPVAYTFCSTARATSTRPAPWPNTGTAGVVCAVLTRASLSPDAFQSGWAWASSAAAPATCGVAIDVPDAAV
jgi:hypothetical protein